MDVLTQEQRARNMRAIRSANTEMEVVLAKALWSRGYHYRKNDKTVFGKPDLTFKKLKIAVFVDSEFFHGKDWESEKHRIKTNRDFWWNKIENNIARDILVNRKLRKDGWLVLRFWSKDVRKHTQICVERIERNIKKCQKNILK